MANFNRLQFPSHFGEESGHWMTYTRKKYSRATMNDPSTLEDIDGSRTVALPIPRNLQKSYTAQWDDDNLGAYGTERAAHIESSVRRYQQNNGIHSLDDMIKVLGGTTDNAKRLATAYASDAITDTSIFREGGRALGIAKNPYKALLFNNVNFRTFTFEYHFVASKFEESVAVKNIIDEFHIGMSPEYTEGTANMLFDYPDVFQIRFEKEKFLFKIAPCILQDLNTDYHAEGKELYFYEGDERVPASIRLSLTFRENQILTRKNFREGY